MNNIARNILENVSFGGHMEAFLFVVFLKVNLLCKLPNSFPNGHI